MEMALLTRCTPQLPQCIRDSARARGRLLMTHGDCHPRQDNQQGVPLRCRFRASAARGAGSSTPKKNLLQLHSSARAQPRLFCSLADYIVEEEQVKDSENGKVSFAVARNKLQEALATNNRQLMLAAIGVLKVFAGDKNYYDVEYKATDLVLTAVLPLAHLSSSAGGKHGGGGGGLEVDDDVVKESLAVACQLLRNAPAKIRATLCSEISREKGVKTSLKRIVQGSGGSGSDPDNDVRKLADEILAQLPSTTPN